MARLKFELYIQPGSENGIGSRFTDGKGNTTTSYWTAPPENIDHSDITYLKDRYPNIKTEWHVKFIKAEFKRQLDENFIEISNNVFEPIKQPNVKTQTENTPEPDLAITVDTRLEKSTGISMQIRAQKGDNFTAYLFKDDMTIGSIGNGTDGFYLHLREQQTVKVMTDILLFIEKLNPVFAKQPFNMAIINNQLA